VRCFANGLTGQICPTPTKEAPMGENIDDLKGKAKEEAGRATDNRDLEAEGKTDQAKADVKRGVDDAADKVKSGLDKVTP
jgi:uncharacterized protein YjbJ (UPF0337 family)